MGIKKKAARYLIPILIVLFAAPILTQTELTKPKPLDDFNCVLCLREHHPRAMRLSTGFNFALVQNFGTAMHATPEILSGTSVDSTLKYLMRDSIRLAVLPYHDSLVSSGNFVCSRIMPDSVIWLANKENELLILSLEKWLDDFSKTSEYRSLKTRFAPSYEPIARVASGRTFDSAGPYDRLVKHYAAKLGWDWRMLEALIWQESQFRIDASSPSGAEGLMQMLPGTAHRFSNDDMLDPEKNLKAGVEYLSMLKSMMSGLCDHRDLTRFVLAAYNAGEGRVLDCFRYAKVKELPCSTWNDFEKVLETLREDKHPYADTTLRYGGIRGRQTLNYVSTVYNLYEAFRLISPGPSSQDQPSTQTKTESAAEALSEDKP